MTTPTAQRWLDGKRAPIVGAPGYDRDDLERLALMAADAIEAAVEAALGGNRTLARRVLRGAKSRKQVKLAAEVGVRQHLALHPPRTGNLPAVAARLQLIAELGRIGDLADVLARPEMDADYRRAGCELRVVVDHLGRSSPGGSAPREPSRATVVATCAAATEAVLLCSRYASRAA